MADSDDRGGLEAFAVALQSTFPARDDASLALALLGLLSDGRAVTATTLTQLPLIETPQPCSAANQSPSRRRRISLRMSNMTLNDARERLNQVASELATSRDAGAIRTGFAELRAHDDRVR